MTNNKKYDIINYTIKKGNKKIWNAVYIVQQICDYEYFCREIVYVSASLENAEEWINKQPDNKKIIGWNDIEYDMYIIEEWEINP